MVEGLFGILKCGGKVICQHCSEQHLKCYLAEFDFRYSNRAALKFDDQRRMCKALEGIQGKRLTYPRTDEATDA
jgi:hypothetical protein